MNPPPTSNSYNNNSVSTSSSKRKREAERSVNWTMEETQVLLCAWSDERIQKSLAENLRNRHVFKHLSARMCELGFSRSPHQCRLRVKTLKANYVRAKLQQSVDSSQPCTFKYFAEMDAVLGRRSSEAGGGPGRLPGPIMGGLVACHVVSSAERTGSLGSDASPRIDMRGGHFGSLGTNGRQHLSSSEDKGGGRCSWPLNSEVKLEDDREDSTEEFEYSDTGMSQPLRDRCHDAFLESTMHHEPGGNPQEDDLSTPSPLQPPPPQPPPPLLLLPPPQPGFTLPPPPPDHHHHHPPIPGGGPSSVRASSSSAPSQPLLLPPQCSSSSSSSLEPTLSHLSECFQRLVSETRGLLVQLEGQRQEQARWHQDLLSHWLEREERRQREAADREERREKARMEHEIKVLELLTGLAVQQRAAGTEQHRCRCSSADGHTVAEPTSAPNHNTEN